MCIGGDVVIVVDAGDDGVILMKQKKARSRPNRSPIVTRQKNATRGSSSLSYSQSYQGPIDFSEWVIDDEETVERCPSGIPSSEAPQPSETENGGYVYIEPVIRDANGDVRMVLLDCPVCHGFVYDCNARGSHLAPVSPERGNRDSASASPARGTEEDATPSSSLKPSGNSGVEEDQSVQPLGEEQVGGSDTECELSYMVPLP
jgi:hypothetical protein